MGRKGHCRSHGATPPKASRNSRGPSPPEPLPRNRATVNVVARHHTGSSRVNPDGETTSTQVAPMDPVCEVVCTRTRMRRRPSP